MELSLDLKSMEMSSNYKINAILIFLQIVARIFFFNVISEIHMVCTERNKKGKTLTSGRNYGVEMDRILELTIEQEGWRLESPILNYGDRGWP